MTYTMRPFHASTGFPAEFRAESLEEAFRLARQRWPLAAHITWLRATRG